MLEEEPGPFEPDGLEPIRLEFMRLEELELLKPEPVPNRFMLEDEPDPFRLLVPAP